MLFYFFIALVDVKVSAKLSCLLGPQGVRNRFVRTSCQDDTTVLKVTVVRGLCKGTKVTPLVVVKDIPLCGIVTIVALSLFTPNNNGLSATGLVQALGKVTAGPVVLNVLANVM